MNRIQRHKRIRKRITGTEKIPRLCAYRSLKGIWAQLIDDSTGNVLTAAHHKQIQSFKTKLDQAKQVGLLIAQHALKKHIVHIVFDRNGYQYHGRIKALAEGAREGGLKF